MLTRHHMLAAARCLCDTDLGFNKSISAARETLFVGNDCKKAIVS